VKRVKEAKLMEMVVQQSDREERSIDALDNVEVLEDLGGKFSEEEDLRCHENFEVIEEYILNRNSRTLSEVDYKATTESHGLKESLSKAVNDNDEDNLECTENFFEIENAIESPDLECPEDFEEIEKLIESQLAADSSSSADQIRRYRKKFKFLVEKCSQLKEKSDYLSQYLQESVERGKEVCVISIFFPF
jgi:hypothetical protein